MNMVFIRTALSRRSQKCKKNWQKSKSIFLTFLGSVVLAGATTRPPLGMAQHKVEPFQRRFLPLNELLNGKVAVERINVVDGVPDGLPNSSRD
jgi:hypothetical protein